MKSINKLIVSLALVVFSFSACQDEPDKIIFKGKIIYFTQSSVSLIENAESPLELTVELSSPATADVTVTFSTTDDSATKDVDYQIAQSSVTIPTGESSASVEITPIDNEVLDAARRFTVSIASVNINNIEISAESEAIVTLVNDDCPVKTGIWAAPKDNNAYETIGEYTYTATFGPNENGDCNILLIYNIGDLGGDKGVALNFTPDSEGATFGTVTIPKQGTGSFGGSGERTVEGSGTYDESTKLIEVSYTFYFGSGALFYSDDVIFDGN
jgi:Calx-beta domain